MKQLDLLWDYQKLDMQMDEYENEKRNSPLRQKLVKLMNYLKEQQEQLVKLNDEADKRNHIYNRIYHEFLNIKDGLKGDEEWLDGDDIKSFKQLDQVEKRLLESQEKVKKKEQELLRLLGDMESLGKKLDEIRVRIAKGKKEYAKVKQQYDAQLQKFKAGCGELQEKREKLAEKIDKSLLNKYKSLKSSHSMAMAVINHDRCGGCNMSLASLVIQRVKDQNGIIECENCGRILYGGSDKVTM